MKPNDFLCRLEARIALALSKAQAALAGIVTLEQHLAVTNSVVIGPAGTIVFSAPLSLTRAGKMRIHAGGFCGPGTAVATDTVTFALLRDGAVIPGSPSTVTDISAVVLDASTALVWEDNVTANTSHTWALQAAITNGSGHTIEFALGGASFGGNAWIVLQDLPG